MAQSAGKQRTGKRTLSATSGGLDQNGRAEAAIGAQHMTDLEFLRGLIEAVDQSGIDSLEINRAGTRIRIAKTPPAAGAAYPAAVPPTHHILPALPTAAASGPAAGGQPAAAPAVPEPAAEPAAASHVHLVDVKSPMVGTFYRAPAPDAPPYVEVGSAVSRGQTLCILEAMKLMNELESEVDGLLREILVEDADPVEYGQVLFRIEPNGR